jgi:hypothetical protein
LRIILIQSTGRSKILRSCIPDVSFGRLNIVRIRRSFCATGSYVGHGLGNRALVGLLEQGSNPLLRLLVGSLAKMVKADLSCGIDEVISRPVLIVEATSNLVVVIHRDGIDDSKILHCFAYVRFILFEGKLRGMNANDHQAACLVFLVPGLDIRQRA